MENLHDLFSKDMNGFRDRGMTARIGIITVRVSRHRRREFNTSMFKRYQRRANRL
ncbi:MAG: hypothetical protein BWY99_01130 [Synergistetes bacterium ADurb.BinA166]|jgi:transposase-like protein|nr:MAG: hypothetical protein BWY99_01130 [Synergistetes bacterium ADurb.BinA166]